MIWRRVNQPGIHRWQPLALASSARLVVRVTVSYTSPVNTPVNKRAEKPLRTPRDKEGEEGRRNTAEVRSNFFLGRRSRTRGVRACRFGHSSGPEITAGLLALEERPKGAITRVRDARTGRSGTGIPVARPLVFVPGASVYI